LCPALPRFVRHEKDAEQLTLIPGDLRGRYNESLRARVGAQMTMPGNYREQEDPWIAELLSNALAR